MRRLALVVLLFALPAFALAEEPLTRRDGFLILWNAIRRPAEEVSDTFDDVREGDAGFLEISYAKARKILDDETTFRPDNALTYEDALLWLYRTRNVADITDMEREDLEALRSRYPVTDAPLADVVASEATLRDLMRILDQTLSAEVHEVSFYGEEFHGDGTAFGETFDKNSLTAAHRSFPWNTLVRVTNVGNSRSVVVRVNDRGPYVAGRDMDLSEAAFAAIASLGSGVARATFQRLGDAGLFDECTGEEQRFQRRITRGVHFFRGIPHTFTLGETLVLQSHRWFVLRGITYPDSPFVRLQDFVAPREKFSFTPSVAGLYVFLLGTVEGRLREMRMRATEC